MCLQEPCGEPAGQNELFCKTDQMCVCKLCSALNHNIHDVVPLKEEYEAEIQQIIHNRRLKIEEIERSVELSQEDAEAAGGKAEEGPAICCGGDSGS